ncbi:hypothetical protein GGQ92_002997 [Gracilibacillus halotolerans]|uniref:Cell surface protein n=1 Tax=Gracilibacillus halotolerans TaxID=74386 RepID=A0A841RS68_9BACI|nr:hypothetical protein [Gracilibacillus halotolerans]MBB6514176.1 hypothetical protein [Gracilibacillus halotolerans]
MADKSEKKSIFKRWWFWLLAIIIVIAIATSGGDDEVVEEDQVEQENAAEQENNEVTPDEDEEEVTENEPEEEEPAEETNDTAAGIEPGTYKVGEELDAGEYLVIADSMTYIESSSDSTGSLESIIFNLNLYSDSHAYITLNDGEYFKLQGGTAYPVTEAPSIQPDDGVYRNGMYKVGEDIPAGEYKVLLDESASMGMGYIEVSTDSRHDLGSIVTNDNPQADTYITVEDGQYLTLQDMYIDTN